jgi:cellulose biosynthesis protein BcsQ
MRFLTMPSSLGAETTRHPRQGRETARRDGGRSAACTACEQGDETAMSYVVPFMNGKGGTGKSVLARAYAVEAARAGASVLIADLDDVQRTSKRWADHRKANGLRPEIRVEVATPRLAYDMADRSEVLVIDAPGWTDRESLKMASWSTFCVIPSRANRMDDLSETVRLLHALKGQGIEDWRFGVALNALRAATARGDDSDARAYLAEVDFKALPGFVRDLKEYEIALLEGKAITETGRTELNDEAFVLVNGIAGAVLEAGKRLAREHRWARQFERDRGRDDGGRGR